MNVKSTRTDTKHLKVIMEKLEPFLTYKVHKKNNRFFINKGNNDFCYFIKSGAVSLHRYPDGVLLEVFDAPTLRGYIPLSCDCETEYVIKMLLSSEVATISKNSLFNLMTSQNLWEDFSRYQMALISSVSEVIYRLSTPNNYHSIRHQLLELMEKPSEIRELITAENYIRCKTRLSRSSIMHILSDLKKGGYITIERGLLLAVHNLPLKY